MLLASPEVLPDQRDVLGSNDENHSDAHVEDTEHLRRLNSTEFLEQREDGKDRPAPNPNAGFATRRKYARNVFGESTAGDMSQSSNQLLLDQWLQYPRVTQVGCQQCFTYRSI